MSSRIFASSRSSYERTAKMIIDREVFEELGVHNNNIKLFINGKYKHGGTDYSGGFKVILLVLLLGGSIYSLIRALDDWVYGYVLFGFGIFLTLIVIFGLIARGQYRKKDPLYLRTMECINYAVLKSIEFFTEEFSLIEVEEYVEEAFLNLHSIGIEREFEEIREMVQEYSLDDPKEEIMSDYLKGILNPIEKNRT